LKRRGEMMLCRKVHDAKNSSNSDIKTSALDLTEWGI
jgi:hypothetical protein